MWKWIQRQASPKVFYETCSRLIPWFFWPFASLLVIGLFWSLVLSPPDYQQGDGYRIIFIHVPSAILSMMVYAIMAIAGGIGLIWQIKMAEVVAKVSAPIGAAFTIIALASGAIWGKPMWGTWWVWDARLTSELILFFLYLGHIALTSAIDDPRRADKAGGILALVGALNVPVIYFSVKWWNTLHQGASVSLTKGSSMAQVMLEAMLIMGVAFWMYAVAMALYRVRSIILVRERHTQWVAELPEVKAQMMKNTSGGANA
jgi:heme exporter protein C